MGNCCGITSNNIQQHEPSLMPQEFPTNVTDTASTTGTNTPFLVTPDPIGLGESGSSSPSSNMPTAMTAQFVDQRLLSLLEFFRQLHFRRKDIFKQILPRHRKDFEDIFERMDTMGEEEKENYKLGGVPLQRSRSSEDLKLERFKVKPIDSPNDKVKGGGSKDSKPPPKK